MLNDTLKLFIKGELTANRILTDDISTMGARLYYYQIFLQKQQGREEEFELIKEYRSKLFAFRDSQEKAIDRLAEISLGIKSVYDLLCVHVILLKSVSDRSWEVESISALLNDMIAYVHFLDDLAKTKIIP